MMKNYSNNFKDYLKDLAAKKPSPGGGSAAALSFCIGLSLMEKAVVYSLDKTPDLKDFYRTLRQSRARIFPYIDLDGKLFAQLMKVKAGKRKPLVKKCQILISDLANNCIKVNSLVRQARPGIKKVILSDFDTGLALVRVALSASIDNLEANVSFFGGECSNVTVFKKALVAWKIF